MGLHQISKNKQHYIKTVHASLYMKECLMYIARLFALLLILSTINFSTNAMEADKPPKKRRLSKALTHLTMHRKHPAPPRAPSSMFTKAKTHPWETFTVQPVPPSAAVQVPPARHEADKQSLKGSPPSPPSSSEEDGAYIPITATPEGTLTSMQPALRHMSPEEANRLDEYGRPPLCLAIMRGQEDEVRALVASGAQTTIRRQGNTLIHEATISRNPSAAIVRFLAEECNQDPNALNAKGLAPLHLAARSGTPDMFRTLVELPNTLLDIQSKEQISCTKTQELTQQTPLHILAAGKRPQAAEMAHSLLQPGNRKIAANPYATDRYGQTALEVAAQSGNEHMVTVLLHYTEIGHDSVEKAYKRAANQKIRDLFKERTDSPSYLSIEQPPQETDATDSDGSGDEVKYVHTTELLK